MSFFQDVSNFLFGSYRVRGSQLLDKSVIQHVRIDVGSGTTESLFSGSVTTNDPLAPYKISDLDEAGATKYYGNLDDAGNWYILQLTSTAARYAKGTSAYTTAWTGRAGLTYDYFDAVF